jgi:hypothetical protein
MASCVYRNTLLLLIVLFLVSVLTVETHCDCKGRMTSPPTVLQDGMELAADGQMVLSDRPLGPPRNLSLNNMIDVVDRAVVSSRLYRGPPAAA